MNCENCAWKNPDTCRICKREHAFKNRNEHPHFDTPENIYYTDDNIYKTMSQDCEFAGFICLNGIEHKHFIYTTIDQTPYIEKQYGHQN